MKSPLLVKLKAYFFLFELQASSDNLTTFLINSTIGPETIADEIVKKYKNSYDKPGALVDKVIENFISEEFLQYIIVDCLGSSADISKLFPIEKVDRTEDDNFVEIYLEQNLEANELEDFYALVMSSQLFKDIRQDNDVFALILK